MKSEGLNVTGWKWGFQTWYLIKSQLNSKALMPKVCYSFQTHTLNKMTLINMFKSYNSMHLWPFKEKGFLQILLSEIVIKDKAIQP